MTTDAPPKPGTFVRLQALVKSDRAAALFVWSVWAVLLAGALGFVAALGVNLPIQDDFELVPFLTGTVPIIPAELWSQHNEHRMPLPRLVMLVLLKLSGNDFRACMYFNALGYGAAALVLILAARALRGASAYTDAVFPLALLHWGQYENLIFTFQVCYVMPVVLTVIVLAVIAVRGNAMAMRSGLLAGICLLLLPLCGAFCLPFTPLLAYWLAWRGVQAWCCGESGGKRAGAIMLVFAVAALLLTDFYFVGLRRDVQHPQAIDLHAALTISGEFLSMGLGLAGKKFWPFSGWLMVCLLVGSGILLMVRWLKFPQERRRSAGLMLFLVAAGSLAAAVGWGRSQFGLEAGFSARYTALAVFGLLCAYFVWLIQGGPGGRYVRWSLLAVLAAALPFNMEAGLMRGKEDMHDPLKFFERDLLGGTPLKQLARRYTKTEEIAIYSENTNAFAHLLKMLHQAGIEPFNKLQGTEELRVLDGFVDEAATHVSGWAWDRNQPNEPVAVEIFAGDKLLGTVLADQFRQDLLEGAIGNGKHGFDFSRAGSPPIGKAERIRVRVAESDFEVPGAANVSADFPSPGFRGLSIILCAIILLLGIAFRRKGATPRSPPEGGTTSSL